MAGVLAVGVCVGPAVAGTGSAAFAAPSCTKITPATLTATVTQPATVFDDVGITFAGTLPDHTAAGSCVVIPASPDLPLRTYGEYPALNTDSERVGTMHVGADGITFTFDPTFLTGRRNISFGGTVRAGMNIDRTQEVTAHDVTWKVTATTDVVVTVPPCPACSGVPETSYKSARVHDADGESSRPSCSASTTGRRWAAPTTP